MIEFINPGRKVKYLLKGREVECHKINRFMKSHPNPKTLNSSLSPSIFARHDLIGRGTLSYLTVRTCSSTASERSQLLGAKRKASEATDDSFDPNEYLDETYKQPSPLQIPDVDESLPTFSHGEALLTKPSTGKSIGGTGTSDALGKAFKRSDWEKWFNFDPESSRSQKTSRKAESQLEDRAAKSSPTSQNSNEPLSDHCASSGSSSVSSSKPLSSASSDHAATEPVRLVANGINCSDIHSASSEPYSTMNPGKFYFPRSPLERGTKPGLWATWMGFVDMLTEQAWSKEVTSIFKELILPLDTHEQQMMHDEKTHHHQMLLVGMDRSEWGNVPGDILPHSQKIALDVLSTTGFMAPSAKIRTLVDYKWCISEAVMNLLYMIKSHQVSGLICDLRIILEISITPHVSLEHKESLYRFSVGSAIFNMALRLFGVSPSSWVSRIESQTPDFRRLLVLLSYWPFNRLSFSIYLIQIYKRLYREEIRIAVREDPTPNMFTNLEILFGPFHPVSTFTRACNTLLTVLSHSPLEDVRGWRDNIPLELDTTLRELLVEVMAELRIRTWFSGDVDASELKKLEELERLAISTLEPLKGLSGEYVKVSLDEAIQVWKIRLRRLPMMYKIFATELPKVDAWLEEDYDGGE